MILNHLLRNRPSSSRIPCRLAARTLYIGRHAKRLLVKAPIVMQIGEKKVPLETHSQSILEKCWSIWSDVFICGGRMWKRVSTQGCCEGVVFKAQTQGCCQGRIYTSAAWWKTCWFECVIKLSNCELFHVNTFIPFAAKLQLNHTVFQHHFDFDHLLWYLCNLKS